jgi:hypothetical protein
MKPVTALEKRNMYINQLLRIAKTKNGQSAILRIPVKKWIDNINKCAKLKQINFWTLNPEDDHDE